MKPITNKFIQISSIVFYLVFSLFSTLFHSHSEELKPQLKLVAHSHTFHNQGKHHDHEDEKGDHSEDLDEHFNSNDSSIDQNLSKNIRSGTEILVLAKLEFIDLKSLNELNKKCYYDLKTDFSIKTLDRYVQLAANISPPLS